MLVLSRRRDESIIIGDDVVVTVIDIKGEQVKLGVSAPRSVSIHRREVYEAIQAENLAAARPEAQNLSQLARVLEKPPDAAGQAGKPKPPVRQIPPKSST